MPPRTNTAKTRKNSSRITPRPKPLTGLEALADHRLIDATLTESLREVAKRFSIAVPQSLVDLIDADDPADPIALQFVPNVRELHDDPLTVPDPIGDAEHSPVKGIIHRYPDRLLLLPVRVCAVYCRFCFRRETVGANESAALSQRELETALEYIRGHKEVWEVILSGGDPLLMSPRRLAEIMDELNRIDHVRVIRIHTRMPVADPIRINAELVASLRIDKPVYVLVHTNHPRELTPDCLSACAKLIDSGVSLLSQSVLLKGVNDNADTLEQLFRKLVENRIKPYYLHHCDRAAGTAHFRTSIKTGQTLMQQLRGRLSGLCLPEYVLDIPGGHGKVPIGPTPFAENNDPIVITDRTGVDHRYFE
jgi:lysine 2,3-aminomutase